MEKITKIILPESLFNALLVHAKKTLPYESVSIIAGTISGTCAIAEKVYTPDNIEESKVSFTVDPLALLDIYTDIEEQNKELIAIYHTHPAQPKPSGTDLHYIEVNPCIWLISSTSEPDKPNGFLLLADGTLKEILIEIRPD